MKTQVALLDDYALMYRVGKRWIAKDLVLVRPDPRQYLKPNKIYDGTVTDKCIIVEGRKYVVKG